MVDESKRKAVIKKQFSDLEKKYGWKIVPDAKLFERVANLVQWPTAFAGTYKKEFLKMPPEVLITSMRDNQRYFSVEDKNGKLLNYFVAVRNGGDHKLDNVIKGNERVLTARLDDAIFFYQFDMAHSIQYFADRLKKVSFHDKISTMYEKMQRVQVICQILGKQVGLNAQQLKDVDRASQIYKYDLTTKMVNEFSELQGTMGYEYALRKGENQHVAQAIGEQYMPTSADAKLPASPEGSVLAFSDKLDSILTFFAAGMIPSGSKDPYALRRQANGMVRIIRANHWNLSLTKLIQALVKGEESASVAPELDQTKQTKNVLRFMNDRIVKLMQQQKIDHDVIEASTQSTNDNILAILATGKMLAQHKSDNDFKDSMDALDRVLRISKKAHFKPSELKVDPSLFQNSSEKPLYEAISKVSKGYAALKPADKYQRLVSLKDPINAYFDKTMVMAKDPQQKANHLKQLSILSNLILSLANLDKLIVE